MINDYLLKSREQTNRIKEMFDVETTPQTFIDGELIGGYDALKRYFGKQSKDSDTSYIPVIAVFSMTFLVALALFIRTEETGSLITLIELFVSLSMCVLAILKLRDLEAFSLQFITYDLLAMRRVRYAYVYAFLEAYTGIGMIALLPAWMVSPPAAFIGTLGAISVFKAVYIDKRDLKCACVGGDSKVPLGFVSLTENLMMMVMALWMWVR